ncbi:hypothetical protein FGRMN_3355 [Fusarium graminum]|nr:hypothetical protein FGRMN_3355 [Fusarium graminum]
MAQNPYYGGNHPPPLFVAELDSQPGRPSDTPSHHKPDGTPVFEMSGEVVLAEQQHHDTNQPSPGMSKPMHQREAKDKPSKDPDQPVTANPWAYFGPESSDSGCRPSEPVYKPYPGNSNSEQDLPEVSYSTRPDGQNDGNGYYPAPLKLAHRPANTVSPPAFKPYAPPAAQDTSDLQPKPSGQPDRADSQSPAVSSSYRPYRPHSPQPPAPHSVPPPSARPTTASPPQSGLLASPPSAPHHFQTTLPSAQSIAPPNPDARLSPKPTTSFPTSPGSQVQTQPQPQPQPQQQYGILNVSPAQPAPSSASTYLPSPMTPSAQTISVAAPSPATPALNVAPLTQSQHAAPVTIPSYTQGPAAGIVSPSPASVASPINAQVPFSQPQYAAPVQVHAYGPSQASTAPSQLQSPVASSPAYNPPQPIAQNSYNIPQSTYAPVQTQAPASALPGTYNRPLTQQPAPYHQAAHVGPVMQQSYPQQSNAQSYSTTAPAPTVSPSSPPPPPYAPHDTGFGVSAQPPATNNHVMYQSSPVGPYPPQPQFPTQPTYAPAMSPPLQGQSTYSLQPPALPPRPSSSQGFAPPSGFGAGPVGYNPANYPRPPQTYFSPPPALPPRPGLGKLSGGGGKIFGSSSADKWLRKTGQALENTLAPYIQGQSSSYRPGSNGPQGQQGQPVHQVPGAYPQGHHFHAPQLAPQFRGNPGSGPPPHGPGAP